MPNNVGADPDAVLIARVADKQDFFRSFFEDGLDDWKLVEDLGEFLLRIAPGEAMAHALLARACRHLAEADRSREELERCRVQITQSSAAPMEKELFTQFLADEGKFLDSGR